MRRSTLVIMVGLLSGLAPAAEGQHARERRGVWVGLGFGAGSAEATCSVCDPPRRSGPVAHARLGGTVSGHTLLGVEGTGWLTNGGAIDRALMMVTGIAVVYPWRGRGLHLQGGLGYYQYVEASDSIELSTQGLAVQVGAGFDVPLASGFSLSPFAALVASGFGNPTRRVKATGQMLPLLSDMTISFLRVGLAATLH